MIHVKNRLHLAALAVLLPAVVALGQATATAPVEVAPLNRKQLRQRAIDELVSASLSPYPSLRANAIEGMQVMPDRARSMVLKGMQDPNAGVRFAAVVTSGILRFKSMTPALHPLLGDENASVRAAAIYALHRLGQKIDLTPLADMLRGPDPALRSNVALLLGLLGDRSAVGLLASTAGVPMPRISAARAAVVRLQVAEASALLGDNKALSVLRAGVHSPMGEIQVLAINALGAVGDERGAAVLQTILFQDRPGPQYPVEVRLAAAGTLARIARKKKLAEPKLSGWLGRMESKAREVALGQATHAQPAVRAQTAWVLGWFRDEKSEKGLGRLIQDPDPTVRVTAAAAALRRLGGRG